MSTLTTSTSQDATVPAAACRPSPQGEAGRSSCPCGRRRRPMARRRARARGGGWSSAAMPVTAVDGLGGERRDGGRDGVERTVGEVRRSARRSASPSAMRRVRERGQQEGVAAGPDRQVLVGRPRRPRADRVDDDEPPAARAQRAQPPGHVGGRHHRAVRHQAGSRPGPAGSRCGRCRGRRRTAGVPNIRRGGHLLRELVDGAGGEAVRGAERPDEGRQVEGAGDVVHVGVAEEDARRRRRRARR